ncbi:hypothetical protein SHO565_14330 [Streptomyces sp. HO565]
MLRPLVLGRGSVARGCADSEGAITSPVECPALPGWAAAVPDTHARSAEADRVAPRGVRYRQSVIARCKAVLPQLPPAETSTARENPAFPVRRSFPDDRFPPGRAGSADPVDPDRALPRLTADL